MLQLSIAGTLGKDAELRVAGQGQVCSFSVAVNGYDFKAKAKTTTWVRVSIWGKRGEQLVPMLTKGSRVALSGDMRLREYQKDGHTVTSVELTAQDVSLLGGGADRERQPAPAAASKPQASFEDDDDIPF